jgi:universal bacterial protein YeaZ
MYYLSLETSTKIFSLSVSRDEKVLRFRNITTAKLLENSIITAIDKLLDSAKVKFDQLDAFVIGLGPGSFTSLRVGLSTVKAFVMATEKPVVGICSLDVIAAAITDGAYDQICVLNDARRGNVYAAIYAQGQCQTGHLLTTVTQVLDMVKGRTFFVGDALALYRKDIEAAYKAY